MLLMCGCLHLSSAATSLDASQNEATGVTEVTGPLPPSLELKQKTPKRNRCTVCRKKVGLTGGSSGRVSGRVRVSLEGRVSGRVRV